jgi:cytochrome c-type biogenesis protein CcmH/NrfG
MTARAARRLAEIARLYAAGLLIDQEYGQKRQEIIRQL